MGCVAKQKENNNKLMKMYFELEFQLYLEKVSNLVKEKWERREMGNGEIRIIMDFFGFSMMDIL